MDVTEFEDVVVHRGSRSGAVMVVAVHSTRLGPALGGARMWHYETPGDGVADAMRLARAMTFKAAAASLDLGGGKGVICAPPGGPPEGEDRRALLLDFADVVESLEGRYVTAEDVGTSAVDMAVIADGTTHVVGLSTDLGGFGDPSPLTARGVAGGIGACLAERFGSADPAGRRVCIVGTGSVGMRLGALLAERGAELTMSDIDPSRRPLAAKLGATWADPDDALLTPCDVLAPCALGGAIDSAVADALRCEIVCGAANNVLSESAVADELAQRGILFAPDFIANAGGLINVYAELRSLPRSDVDVLVDGIGAVLSEVFSTARAAGTTPLAAARELALARLRGPASVAA
jgi:leucine dehydrogenase